VLFAVGVALHYPWELAQSQLYEGTKSTRGVFWHCFVASLGDGLLTLLIVGFVAVFRQDLPRAGPLTYGALSITGAATAIAVEWVGTRLLERWAYADAMPTVPSLEVGLPPLLQMALLTPAAVWLTRRRQTGPPA
jgi:hypothetical protein